MLYLIDALFIRVFVFQHLPVKYEHFSPIQQCIEVFVHVIAEQIVCDNEKMSFRNNQDFYQTGLVFAII